MKKTSAIIFVLILAGTLTVLLSGVAYADNGGRAIQTVAVTDGDVKGTATLYGKGETFITDLTVSVKFEGYEQYGFALEDGYSPSIEVFDFGDENKLLFCSSQTGGSGGYGNYRVYRLKTQSYQLLYDDKINSQSATFGAAFMPNGFMQLTNNATGDTLDVYVGYMNKEFYNKIFKQDGTLTGEQPYVNDISFVTPALNSASGLWRLITYRSVISIAEVNRLGYIVQTLEFDGKTFKSSFTEFAINL